MADDGKERREHKRVGVNLRIRVKYQQVDDFIEAYAVNISRGGIFIKSPKPHPVQTKLRFEIQLKGGQAILRGHGEVAWVNMPALPGQKAKPPGMGVKFVQLDDASRALVDRILEIKEQKSSALESPLDVEIDIDEPEETPLDEIEVDIEEPPVESSVEVSEELEVEIEESDDLDVDISVDDFAAPTTPDAGGTPVGPVAPSGGATGRIIGIDLGTTNSCAAVVIDGKPQVIPTRKGYRTIPSIVAYTDDERLLVGHRAKSQMELNPTNTVYGSKRLVGRPFDSPAVQQMKDRFHYEIIEGPKNEAAVRVVSRNFSLQQVAAFILSEIRDVARELLKEEVNRAVITVPAYFNENQRQAVREAGTLAGLQVERIVNEPTAAALAFGYNRGLDQRVMVYDLGGGTFDASVMEVYENVYEVISTGGDTFLGGVDFDNQLVDHLLFAFCQDLGQVPEFDRAAMQRLREAAEQAKCALSEKSETIVRLPFFTAVNNAPKDLEVRVSRSMLEELVTPLVERTLVVAQNVLEQARLGSKRLDNILLVGGQSRMPLIWKRIQETFGLAPYKGVHPDEAVALGAALLADSQDSLSAVVLIDVLPVSIGIGIPGGRFLKVLEGGTALPATKTNTIRTFKDDQADLELTVFQGESDRVVDNEYLGTVNISGISPAPKGAVQLEITFSLDQECLLKVSTRELTSGKLIETQLATKDTQETIRRKLQIPEGEVSTQTYGQPKSIKREADSKPLEEAKDKEGGLLGKLFGRKK